MLAFRTYPLLLLAFVGLSWSVQPALVKFALVSGLTQEEVLLFMTGGVAFGACISLTIQRLWPRPSVALLLFLIVGGCLAELIPAFVRTIAAPNLPIGAMALIVCTTPIFTVVSSVILRTEKVSAFRFLAIVFGMASAAILLWPGTALSLGQRPWAVVMFVIPLSYAGYQQFALRFWPEKLNEWQVAYLQSFVGFLVFLPFLLFFQPGALIMGQLTLGHVAILLWVVIALIENIAFFVLLKQNGPSFVSFGTFISVMAAPLWGGLFFSEVVSLGYFSSVLAFAASVFLLLLDRRRAAMRLEK